MIEIKLLDKPQNINIAHTWSLPLFNVYVFQHPTWNCQLFTVANIQNIFNQSKDIQLEILKTIATTVAKPRMLIDIRECHAQKVDALFTPNQIIFKQPYMSSNNHEMIIYQIDVQHLYPH